MKQCKKCKETKPLAGFHKRNDTKDGYRAVCSACVNAGGTRKTFVCGGCNKPVTMALKNYNQKKTDLCVECWKKEMSKVNKAAVGDKNPAWKGGRTITTKGYIYVTDKTQKCGYILEHRAVMAKCIGRPLEIGEEVHHIDEDKQNNKIENLYLTNSTEHNRIHSNLDYLEKSKAKKSK